MYISVYQIGRLYREYTKKALTVDELVISFMGNSKSKRNQGDNYATVRPVAISWGKTSFETYLAVQNVEGLKKGVYRYLALEHKLLFFI